MSEPLPRAFGAPVFRWIGGSMLVVGLVVLWRTPRLAAVAPPDADRRG